MFQLTPGATPTAATTAPATQPVAPLPTPDTGPINPAVQVERLLNSLGLHKTWTDTTWREWLILLVCIFASVLAGRVGTEIFRRISDRLRGTGAHATGTIFGSGAGPISLFCVTIGIWAGLKPIAMEPGLRDVTTRVVTLLFALSMGWFLFNLVDLIDYWLHRLAAKTKSHLDDQVAPLIRKTLRIFLVVLIGLYIAQNVFEQNITTWLAGLGIAGLAVSLAAQDSIKNLFGSVTIFMDKPFSVGDRILFDVIDGTVIEIGFRSTKVRMAGGEIATIPNSKFIDNAVRNISARGGTPRTIDVPLAAGSGPDKIIAAIKKIQAILADPTIAQGLETGSDAPHVYLDDVKGGVPVVKVSYRFKTADARGCAEHGQQLQLRILEGLATV